MGWAGEVVAHRTNVFVRSAAQGYPVREAFRASSRYVLIAVPTWNGHSGEKPVRIAFASGKGGTGKTTLVASLSHLLKNKVVSDCECGCGEPAYFTGTPGGAFKEEIYGGQEGLYRPGKMHAVWHLQGRMRLRRHI